MKRIWLWIAPVIIVVCALVTLYPTRDESPPQAAFFYWTSGKAVRMGDTESALALLETLARFNDQNPWILAMLGDTQHLHLLGMDPGPERDALAQAALDNLHRALELQPRFLRAQVCLADLLDTMERYDEARALLDQALEQNPYSDEAHEEYAWLLLDLGDLEGAGEHAVYTLDERYDPSLLDREIHFEFQENIALNKTERVLVSYRTTSRITDPALYQFFGPDSWYVEDKVWAMSLADVHDQTPDIHAGTFPASTGKEYLAKCGLEPVSLEILSVEPVEP